MRAWMGLPAAALASRRRSASKLLCVAAVVAAHGALWLALSLPAAAPRAKPTAAVQVRHVVADARATKPAPRVAAPVAAPAPARPVRRRPASARPLPPDGAAARDAEVPAAAVSLPVYPTRIPPSARLSYALQRGAVTGEASLDWQVDGDRYRLQLQSTLSQGRPVDRHSEGGFDAAGLAPLRLADQQRGRDVRAANFQRERGLVSFSGPRWEWPLYAGTQDSLSWLVQLVAIAAAAPDSLREGAVLSMWVVGTRGALSAWRFEVRGRETLSVAAGDAWLLVREPEHPYDLRIELWLDPARGHWPARMRQAQVPGGEPLQWLLRDEPAAGG